MKNQKNTARKNDISLYDTYETPIEYITRETTNEDVLEITPYDKIVERVVVKPEVSKSDIAKAIADLDIDELNMLKDRIITLVDIKKENKKLKLEHDIA